MSDCDCCTAAGINPFSGIYRKDCAPCEARQVSHAPKVIRERFYAQINDLEERAAFIEAVNLEYERRRAWASK